MMKNVFIGLAILYLNFVLFVSCNDKINDENSNSYIIKNISTNNLNSENIKVTEYVLQNAVIAYKGCVNFAPEETEAAYRWARYIGVDYLELTLQLTKDGVLIAFHDDNLKRSTNIITKYPDKKDYNINNITYNELVTLDAGSWFNVSNTNNSRPSFEKEIILTLEDIINIAQGKKISRNLDGTRKFDYNSNENKYTFYYENDIIDNGNRPGLYIVLKNTKLNPNIEKKLYDELERLGWNIITNPLVENTFFKENKVNTGNTNGRVIIQITSKQSTIEIEKYFKGLVPTCFMLDGGGELLIQPSSVLNYAEAVNFVVSHKINFTSPSIDGGLTNLPNLLNSWQEELIHKTGIKTHAFLFDNITQMKKYFGEKSDRDENGDLLFNPLSDAMYTSSPDIAINFLINLKLRPEGIAGNNIDPKEVLNILGY